VRVAPKGLNTFGATVAGQCLRTVAAATFWWLLRIVASSADTGNEPPMRIHAAPENVGLRSVTDEFKNVGRHLGEGEYVTLPIDGTTDDATIEGWFIWLTGPGPLFATTNGEWAVLFERDGHCAYRVGGEERSTSVAVESVQDRWIYVAVAKAGSEVVVRIDDAIVDRWEDAPSGARLSESVVMKDAVGFAADIAYYDRRVADDRLAAHWNAGKDRV
jgi:hypothetical protein